MPFAPDSGLSAVDVVLDELLAMVQSDHDTQVCTLKDSISKILAEDIYSAFDVPPLDNSAVDGYAFSHADGKPGQTLPVSQRIPAGATASPLDPGTAARIFTGAPIPEGADCVVMQEHTCFSDQSRTISLQRIPEPGANIRSAGQDITANSVILRKGCALTPQRLGMIASVGQAQVSVYRPLKVAIFSTGDELIEPGTECIPGKIYNSNRYTLFSMLENLGMEVIDLGVIADDANATREALSSAAKAADVIISTGGASVGEEDHVQQTLKELGELKLWRVAIKPGKPFMFGQVNNCPVLGLPGNPSAVLVTFLMLARPFLLKRQGSLNVKNESYQMPANFSVTRPGKRQEYLRVKINASGRLDTHPNQSSGMLSSACWADGLAVVPIDTTIAPGDLLEYLPFSALLSKPL